MSLSIKISNFLGGMKGPEGQYRGDINDSILHADNFLVERSGAMRNRPAARDLGISLLPTDRSVSFEFDGDFFTYVYDPYIETSFEKVPNVPFIGNLNEAQSATEILNNYDYFRNPKFAFKDALGNIHNMYNYDPTGTTSATNPNNPTIPQLEMINAYLAHTGSITGTAIQTWFDDPLNLYHVYLGALIDRVGLIQTYKFLCAEANLQLLIDTENSFLAGINRDTPLRMMQALITGSSPQLFSISLNRQNGLSGMYYSRSLVYKNDTLIETDIHRPFPMGQGNPLRSTRTSQSEQAPTIRTLKNGFWRRGIDLSTEFTYDYRVAKTVNHVLLTNPDGVLPPILLDMRSREGDKVTAYDIRCMWMSPESSDTAPGIINAGIIQRPSYLTQDEFEAAGSSRTGFRSPTGSPMVNSGRPVSNELITASLANDTDTTNVFDRALPSDAPLVEEARLLQTSPTFIGTRLEAWENDVHFRLSPSINIPVDATRMLFSDKAFTHTLYYQEYPIVMFNKFPEETDTSGGQVVTNFASKALCFYTPEFFTLRSTLNQGGQRILEAPFHFTPRVRQSNPLTFSTPIITTNNNIAGTSYVILSYWHRFSQEKSDPQFENFNSLVEDYSFNLSVHNGTFTTIKSTVGATKININAHGLNWRDFPKYAIAVFGRIYFAATNTQKATVMTTRNTGVSLGLLRFSGGANLKADPMNPVLDDGFIQVFTSEGGIQILWVAFLENQLKIGTTRGIFSIPGTANITDYAMARGVLEEQPSPFQPVDTFAATYQLLSDAITLYIVEFSEELNRNRYITLSSDIDDYISTGIRKMVSSKSAGRIVVLVGSRVFTGLVKDDGRLAWTELTFASPVRDIHEDEDIIYIGTESTVLSLNFTERTDIEEGVSLSFTLPSVLAYLIKSNAPTMDRLDQYEIIRGHIIGEITRKAAIGSDQGEPQYVSLKKNSVSFSQVRLKNEDDAPKITFNGRKVRVSSAIFEIGGVG